MQLMLGMQRNNMKKLNVVGLFCLLLITQLSYASNESDENVEYRARLMQGRDNIIRACATGMFIMDVGIFIAGHAVTNLRDHPEKDTAYHEIMHASGSMISILGGSIVGASYVASLWNQQEINRVSRSR